MTCQDCIHFTNNTIGELHRCDYEHEHIALMHVKGDKEICDHFDNNDGSYHDGAWHCHRCGKIVEVAGLCYECEKWLSDNPIDESWDEVSK